MKVGYTAFVTYKRPCVDFHRRLLIKLFADMLCRLVIFLLLYHLFENLGSLIEVIPDATKFSQRAEVWSFQLVQIMMKIVTAFDEIWRIALYCKLYFTSDWVIELEINENIIGAFFQPIFNSDNFEFFRILFAEWLKLFVNSHDFLLFGWDLTSH